LGLRFVASESRSRPRIAPVGLTGTERPGTPWPPSAAVPRRAIEPRTRRARAGGRTGSPGLSAAQTRDSHGRDGSAEQRRSWSYKPATPRGAACSRHTSTRRPPRRRSSTSPVSPTSGQDARSSLAIAPTTTSRSIPWGPPRPTSRRVRAASWERLHYDWSDPNRVVLTTTDSNAWGGDSGHLHFHTQSRRNDRH
jgi:hypothetical protein